MNHHRLQVVQYTALAVAALLALGGLVYAALSTPIGVLVDSWLPANAFGALLGIPMAWALCRAEPDHRVVWVFVGAIAITGLQVPVIAIVEAWAADAGVAYAFVPPDQMPFGVYVANALQASTWPLIVIPMVTVLPLLFPDGRLPSSRWRPVAWLGAAATALVPLGLIYMTAIETSIPLDQQYTDPQGLGWLAAIGLSALFPAAVAASVVGLIVKMRRADGVERHQIRWFVFGAAVFGAGAGTFIFDQTGELFRIVVMPMLVVFFGSITVAILRYRLYDIDIVIRRSVVFGALAIFITGVYVAVVVGIGNLIGDTSNLLLAVGATALVAVLFEPVRARVQHWANVWVYGERATPYEVLAGMSASDRTPDEQLSEGARLLAEATGADHVVVWSGRGSSRFACATWPAESAPDRSTWDLEHDIVSEDGAIGSVALAKRPGEPPTTQDRRLVSEFAGQASLLLANMQLNESLRQRLEQLGESRRRLVSAQDETRRKLERDLHDGAQQQVVALKVKLGLAKTMAANEGAEKVAEMVAQISVEAEDAVDTLRDLARGIYPPLLEAEGLQVAVEAQARSAPIPVTVHAAGMERYSREVETAVYFCVLEALSNVIKYAEASSAHVRLEQFGDRLRFSVEDDGVGFDPHKATSGTGLQGIADRIDTLGGELEVTSARGSGTRVEGTVALERARTELSSV